MLGMLIDAHGHYTTVPAGLRVFRALQISQMGRPVKKGPSITDDEIRSSLEQGQLKLMDQRGIDMMLFSPMASAMGHHFGSARISRHWTEVNNDLIHRACRLFPTRFVGVCALPQSPGVSPRECAEELERCVRDLGFVGCNLNPDPSGGYWTDPPLGDEWWYPLYEKLEALDVPAMIHASATCNPAFHTVGSHYLNVDSTGFLQLMESRAFQSRIPDQSLLSITNQGDNGIAIVARATGGFGIGLEAESTAVPECSPAATRVQASLR